MSQHYIGVKQVFAYPEAKDGRDGYHVVYRYGQPDAYHSWSPKEEFERFYLPMGESADGSRISQEMVDGFLVSADAYDRAGGKMTVVDIELANGTLYTESSACVDPKNYCQETGKEVCVERAKNRIWHLLGFVLQWSRTGLRTGLRTAAAVVVAILFFAATAMAADPEPRFFNPAQEARIQRLEADVAALKAIVGPLAPAAMPTASVAVPAPAVVAPAFETVSLDGGATWFTRPAAGTAVTTFPTPIRSAVRQYLTPRTTCVNGVCTTTYR